MIFDTDVMIWFLRGNDKASDAIVENLPFSISVVTYMELIQGMRDKRELEKMKKSLREMDVKIIPLTERISLHASNYVEEHFLGNSLELADALIAATCIEYNDTIFTANDKHYKVIPGLKMEVFRP